MDPKPHVLVHGIALTLITILDTAKYTLVNNVR